ncbi:MAG: glycosyltransferase [Nitrospirae bacterium]|nr:glycosyltransferase [Magnetococcales bacterium]
MTARELPKILFATPRFLFPLDTGGQIRSAKILRAAHGTLLDVTLISPATPQELHTYGQELKGVCDRFIPYAPRWKNPLSRWLGRVFSLMGPWPVSVATDFSPSFQQLLLQQRALGNHCAEVCDFLHLAVNYDTMPPNIPVILFTHNVEQEIFHRRRDVATHWWHRWLWHNQYRKMRHLEESVIPRFPRILTVSDRDSHFFRSTSQHSDIRTIPTGVDFEHLPWHPPADTLEVVFMGSMDAHQNVDGIQWFLKEVWPLLKRRVPLARVRIIGRYPPRSLTSAYESDQQVTFTGWVDDVAGASRTGQVFAVPLRVGSGTRIKIYEAMALGLPVISTSIGAEGLELEPNIHYLKADSPEAFSDALAMMLLDWEKCLEFSKRARAQVETCCGWRHAAEVLMAACMEPVCGQ